LIELDYGPNEEDISTRFQILGMKNLIYFGYLIIFVSMVFTLLVFDNFSRFNAACQVEGCSDMNVFFTMLFGLFIAGAFVTIDTIVGYILVREKPWQAEVYKRPRTTIKPSERIANLKSELENLKRAKEETEKQYYKGKFSTKTFEKMLNKYDTKIIETKSRIKSIKAKKG